MHPRTIHIEPEAPPKPRVGAPCNGCGVCCLAEPCPLGMLLSGRRTGACAALRWDAAERRYQCGAITDTAAVWQQRWPRLLHSAWALRWVRWWAPLLRRLALRWIAAGRGCDSTLQPESPGQPPD
jgi:hypothetical protein